MRKKKIEKKKAIEMRTDGLSIKEIAKSLQVSSSSISIWVKGVVLTEDQKEKLKKKSLISREKGLLSIKNKREKIHRALIEQVKRDLNTIRYEPRLYRLLCSFLYWGEGAKTGNCVSFINSDPYMVESYLFLLRKGFGVDESKFRCLVHLHGYHDEQGVKKFWSDVTDIPLKQFQKSYLKPNSGKVVREGYPGSVCVKYYDASIFHQLKVSYLEFFNQQVRGVG